MARLCQICEQLESKYKCPSCRAPYCSAACYKTHKETPCEAAGATTNGADGTTATGANIPASEQAAPQNGSKPRAKEEDDDDDIDPTKLLTTEQLARLRQSTAAKQQLANPHIRELLTQIDSSSNRMKALEKALLDPVFSEFMFRTLDEIESNA